MGKGDEQVQASNYKINHEDVTYNMVVVNKTILRVSELLRE